MSNAKYSVLFMRDDRDVTRYRVSPFWLKMFVFSQIFLLLCAAGGIYMGVRGFKINNELRGENKSLEQRLVDAEVRLERLGNMEKILQSYDPAELQSLLSAATTEVEKAPEPEKVDLNKIFTRVDTQQVGVENLQARLTGRKMSISFELNNLQASKAVVGTSDLKLVMKDGSPVPLGPKRIKTTFQLPNGVTQKELFGLRLEIKGKGGDVFFAETYPLYHILS